MNFNNKYVIQIKFKINPTYFFLMYKACSNTLIADSIRYLLIDIFGKSTDQLTKTLKTLIMKTD